MALTGTAALNRSQESAEAEAGSIDSPVKECLSWIGVAAIYDDPWATPVTGCHVRIMGEGGIVADGPRTKGLSAYGKEDGQPHDDVRAELGVYRQSGVIPGLVVIELVPDGNEDPQEIAKQIFSNLETFETSMRQLLQSWIAEWAKDGWLSIPRANRRGEVRGLGAWWEGEMDFWAGVGDGIKSSAHKFSDLPLLEQLGWITSPLVMVGRKLIDWLAETAQTLWDRRDQLMKLLKAFFEGTAKAIEHALEALVDLPGELGPLIKDLVKHSAEWVQNMIEVSLETDVFKRVAKTIMTVVMMMTPNFWAEGIGTIEGYLLPEVLITIVLIIIGGLCAAAGASTLAARIAGTLSKLRKALGAVDKIGQVLKTLFSKLDELAELIGKLSKALRSNIKEIGQGTTDKLNKLVRRSVGKLSQGERLALFYKNLSNAKAARNADEAFELLSKTLNQVEDAHSGVKAIADPGLEYTGRMYPPKADFMTRLPNGDIEALTKGQRLLFGADGSIKIFSRKSGEMVFQKAGRQ